MMFKRFHCQTYTGAWYSVDSLKSRDTINYMYSTEHTTRDDALKYKPSASAMRIEMLRREGKLMDYVAVQGAKL